MSDSYWGMPISIRQVATNPVDTDSSCIQTLQQMTNIARSSASSPTIAGIVDSCIASLQYLRNPTNKDLARALFYWVKHHLTFREDEDVVSRIMGQQDPYQELLITPEVLLRMPEPTGDCDDYSMLLASLLACAQIPCCYTVIAADREQPERFSHVYCSAFLDGRWTPIDPSYGSVLGWEHKGYRRMDWRVN